MHSSNRSRRGRVAVASVGVLAMVASLVLTGCSSSATGASSAPAAGAGVELTFMNQSRGQEAALNQLAKAYTAKTGVKVTIDTPGPADYLAKLQAKAQANTMPDVYSSFNATDMAAYYKAGWAMDLTDELKAGWSKSFSPAVLKMSAFEQGNNLGIPAGTYTVHWETQTYGFMVNPALTGIAKGASLTTMDDFVSALAAKDSKHLGNLAIASTLTPQLLQGLASNWLTDEQIAATFNGKESWKTDAWRKSLQVLVDMKKAAVIANGTLQSGNDDNPKVETAFFTQQMGAVFDASPGVSVGLRTNPEFTEYFSIAVPKLSGGTLDPRGPGVPGKGAVINPKGAHPKEALAFVKWLTEADQQKTFAEVGRILPTNPELLAGGSVPEQLAGYGAGVAKMQVMSATITPDVKAAIVAQTQRLVLGEVSVDGALDIIQAAQDRK